MTKSTIETITFINKLVEFGWPFDEIELEKRLCVLGCDICETVGHRKDFKLPNGLRACAYLDNDWCQIEIDIDVYLEAEALDETEYEKKLNEFQIKYEKTVCDVKNIVGEPGFSGTFADESFPDDQDAISLTLWQQRSSRFMVQLKHEGREIPIRVTFVIAPLAEI